MSVKAKLAILKSFVVSFVRDGEEQEVEIRSHGPEGTMRIHPGGSVYLGTMDLLLSLAGIVTCVRGVVFRIRASDGEIVAETKNTYRAESYFVNDEAVEGNLCWEFLGDESRIAVAQEACKTFPALATLVKTARAELKRRAA